MSNHVGSRYSLVKRKAAFEHKGHRVVLESWRKNGVEGVSHYHMRVYSGSMYVSLPLQAGASFAKWRSKFQNALDLLDGAFQFDI